MDAATHCRFVMARTAACLPTAMAAATSPIFSHSSCNTACSTGDDAPNTPPSDLIAPSRDDAEQRRRKIQQARAIYDSGVWDKRIQAYLRSRGITLTSPILRFCESAPHRLGARLPAMLAPVVDISGEQIGAHLTYLRRGGDGKADLPKEHQRECRGALAGGAIRLMPFNPGRRTHPL